MTPRSRTSRGASSRSIADESENFELAVQRLALATVRQILATELERVRADIKSGKLKVGKQGARGRVARDNDVAGRRGRGRRAASAAPSGDAGSTDVAADAERGAGAVDTLPDETAVPSLSTSGKSSKRRPWTRESVVNELAGWIVSGTTVDASFVQRHGPPGLVAATRRLFGRFDAAMNVAGLHVSKLYPDGPPKRAFDNRPA